MPTVLYPRCLVQIAALLDNQLGVAIPNDFTVIPRSAEVKRNSARQADTATIELDYSDFPLDPRLFQDATVAVFLEALPLPRAPMVARPVGVPGLAANMRFVGLLDEPKTNLGNSGNTVTLQCRDYTGVFLDYKWPYATTQQPLGTLPTPPGTPLIALVEKIRTTVAPETNPPIFAPGTELLDVSAKTAKGLFVGQENDSAWDALSRVCDLFGLVPTWNLDQLEIRSPSQPGTGGALMVYGSNVESLEFSRDLRRQKATQTKIVAWNPILGQTFEAVWPSDAQAIAEGAAKSTARVGKAVPKDPATNPTVTIKQVQYNVEGNYTPADVLALAIAVHTESRQHVLAGQMQTRDTTDLLGGDLMALQNGDQLICKLGPEDLSSIAGMTPGEAIAFLSNPDRANAMSPDAATALVTAYEQVQQLSITFYVTEVEHRWSREDGYRLTTRFRDFQLGA